MRTLISTAFVSLDGVVEAPGGEPGYRNSGWTFKNVEFVPEAYELKGREQEESTALLLGRLSYQAFSPVWPGMEEFAGYKAMPKYVVSTTLTDADLEEAWGETTILRSAADVAALKETEPVGSGPDRPVPPAGVSVVAGRGQANVQRRGQGRPEPEAGRVRGLLQRYPEECVRRRSLTGDFTGVHFTGVLSARR
jgi:hypothetical protein